MLLTALFVAVVVVSVTSENVKYGLLGSEVTLVPDAGSVTKTTKSILWKVGPDLAIELEDGVITGYRHFKERGNLNNVTGALTIRGLVMTDSSTYTPSIDTKTGTPIRLVVLSAVPEPTITALILKEMSEYKLTCDGDITDAGDVSFTWTSDNNMQPLSTQRGYTIMKNNSDVKEFTCQMKNQVTLKKSKPYTNPLYTPPDSNLNISKGVTVFICLLLPLLLLGIFHRVKTGMWFFEKSSLPWEAEFWKKNERQQLGPTESNGTTTPQTEVKSDEETPMTQS